MRVRWFAMSRPVRIWTAALLLGSGASGAWATEDDDFFRSLDQAEALAALTAADPVPSRPGRPAEDPRPIVPVNLPHRADPTPGVDPQRLAPFFETDERWDASEGGTTDPRRLDPTGWAPDHARTTGGALAAVDRLKTRDLPTRDLPTRDLKVGGSDPEPDIGVQPEVRPGDRPVDPLDRIPAPAAVSPQAEPLPPLNAALKRALDKRDAADFRGTGAGERRKERAAIAFFYASHGFAPIWSRDGRPVDAVESLVAALARAGDDALTLPPPPAGVTVGGSPDEIAAGELALTEAVVAYARQATGSRVNPHDVSPLIGSLPQLADPAEVLDRLAGAGREAGAKLQELNPTEPRYIALRDKLIELRQARSASGAAPIPPGPVLHVGMRDRRVPLLRARFHLGLGPRADDLKYDSELASAVADFQRASELPPSGALTVATALALSGGPSTRLEGVLLTNMEMWRWMPRDLGASRIEVNVPDYIVTVFHDGQPVDRHRVVVGKLDTPTPLFSNTMKYLIVNPFWNVPQSIIKKEMLPKYHDLSYLDGRGYSVSYRGGAATVRQLPGPRNALGRIKFLFPNDYSVYLHDTPSKALFSAGKRAFSHGCVRVDQPFSFAETVLNTALPDGARRVWSEDRLTDMIGDKEHYINLPTGLPIHIAYFTATVDGGRVKLREDVYGYARQVALALGQTAEPVAVSERKPRIVAERVHRRSGETLVDDGADPR